MKGRAKALLDAWGKRRPDQLFPVFFVGQDLNAPRATLRSGDLWEFQDRRTIRAWSEAFGIPDDGRPWHVLPFVTTLVCPTADLANDIIAKHLRLDAAEAEVERWLLANP